MHGATAADNGFWCLMRTVALRNQKRGFFRADSTLIRSAVIEVRQEDIEERFDSEYLAQSGAVSRCSIQRCCSSARVARSMAPDSGAEPGRRHC